MEDYLEVDIENPGHELESVLVEINDSAALKILPYHQLSGGTHKMVSCSGMYRRIPKGTEELVESTSGNTGYASALYAQTIGMPLRIYMPEGMPQKKIELLRKMGVCVLETPRHEYTAGARNEAQKYYDEKPDTRWFFNQAKNPGNWQSHQELAYKLTGSTHLVLIGGTCGAIAGLGRGLRAANDVIITQIDLDAGPHFLNRKHGRLTEWQDHAIIGAAPAKMSPIGEEFYSSVDRVAVVNADECEALFGEALKCNLNVGKSSAVNLAAAARMAKVFQAQVATATYDHLDRYGEADTLSGDLGFDVKNINAFLKTEIAQCINIRLEGLHDSVIYPI